MASSEDKHSLDPLECSVCLEPLLDRNPRLLVCGHTFCTPCLENMTTCTKVLKCPKCRANMTLPTGGVESLPKNTDFCHIMEKQIYNSPQNKGTCQICRRKVAEFVCINCKNRLICKECAKLHSDVPALKSHQLLLICEKQVSTEHTTCEIHQEVNEFFCSACETAICVECIVCPEHLEHKSSICDIEAGLKSFQAELEICKSNMQDMSITLASGAQTLRQKLDILHVSRNKIGNICKNLEEKLKILREHLKEVKKPEETLQNLISEVEGQTQAITQHQKQMIKDMTGNKLNESKKWRDQAKKIIFTAQALLTKEYKCVEYLAGTFRLNGNVGKIAWSEFTLETCKKALNDEKKESEIKNGTEKQKQPKPNFGSDAAGPAEEKLNLPRNEEQPGIKQKETMACTMNLPEKDKNESEFPREGKQKAESENKQEKTCRNESDAVGYGRSYDGFGNYGGIGNYGGFGNYGGIGNYGGFGNYDRGYYYGDGSFFGTGPRGRGRPYRKKSDSKSKKPEKE